MAEAVAESVNTGMQPARILCVDDEANILSALRRVFRPLGYQVFTADSGAEALALLQTQPIDLVISDMRMPEMDGAQLLEQVRALYPQTMRLLLTGYADIQSILDAINKGEIYRYISKPWDDVEIRLTVQQALERKALQEEKDRLEKLTQQQNESLVALNASLEAKVEERTAALKQANSALTGLNQKLKTSFLTSIKIFSNLIEMRAVHLAGHSRRVADLARRIATRLNLTPAETQEIFIAGLLHNIGKIGFSDELLAMPVNMMNGDTLGVYRKFTVRGEQLLMPLEDLAATARIIRSHQERFDGGGFPDRLSGFNIPMGARILALASDYENLQNGTLLQRHLRGDEALNMILRGDGKRYDPAVLAAFQEALTGVINTPTDAQPEIAIFTSELKPGMVIARDLIAKDGHLLLSTDHVLDDRLIHQIIGFESIGGLKMTIWVRPPTA
jgi:response regulator RpfG family c-di-GMP phosphodiesterase